MFKLSPGHGGTYAQEFFEKLGTYDSGFDIWGAENLEISFKASFLLCPLSFRPTYHISKSFSITVFSSKKSLDLTFKMTSLTLLYCR